MPNRILRDGILGSRAVNSLSDSGEIFYRRLMSVVDDYGRFEADPELLRARCFPRQLDRWPLSRVSEALSECSEARSSDGVPLLVVYCSITSAEKYCQVNNFDQRIRVDKKGVPTPSKYPAPTLASEAPRSAASSGDSPPKAYAETYAETETKAGKISEFPKRQAGAPDFQSINEAWKWYQEEFPGEVNTFIETQLFISVIETEQDLSDLRVNLPLYKLTQKWIDGFHPSSENFISKRIFKIRPKARDTPKPKVYDGPPLPGWDPIKIFAEQQKKAQQEWEEDAPIRAENAEFEAALLKRLNEKQAAR